MKPTRRTPAPLRALAVAAAVLAVAVGIAVATPESAQAYTENYSSSAIGKVTGEKYDRTFYGSSVEDVMHIVEDMTSTRNNPLHEDSIRIELLSDWDTSGYGRIEVPKNTTFKLYLHGHMLNRGKAMSYGDGLTWYAEGKGEAIILRAQSKLYVYGSGNVDGSSSDSEKATEHRGYTFDEDRFWHYDGKGSAVLTGGLITGGACDDEKGAGGISMAGEKSEAYIYDTTIAGNLADEWVESNGNGGGIGMFGDNSVLRLERSRVVYNHAEGSGGGIYACSGQSSVDLVDCDISHNLGNKDGGGIYTLGSCTTFNVTNCTMDSNKAMKTGGAIKACCDTLNLIGSENSLMSVSNNYAVDKGGAVVLSDCHTFNASYVKFEGNSSGDDGGAIYALGRVDAKIDHTAFSGNTAGGNAGAIYVNRHDSNVELSNSTVQGNTANGKYGGAFYVDGNDCNITLRNTSVSKNSAAKAGGAMYHNGKNGSVTFDASTVSENKIRNNGDDAKGAGIYSCYDGTTFTFKNGSDVFRNYEAMKGGGLYLEDVTTVVLDNSSIRDNTVDSANGGAGGGIYTEDSGTRIVLNNNASIKNNVATTGGSGKCQGGGICSTNTLTVTGDGTGTIEGNQAYGISATAGDGHSYCGDEGGFGGGIWFKGELYLENITITGNEALRSAGQYEKVETENPTSGLGAGVYCDNDSYKNFEVASTVKIVNNTRSDNPRTGELLEDSNLYLKGDQDLCSAAGERALTADSRIGVSTDSTADKRRVTGNYALDKIGDKYGKVFTSDNTGKYGVGVTDGYVYLSKSDVVQCTVTVKTGCYESSFKAGTSQTVILSSKKYLTYEEHEAEVNQAQTRYGSNRNYIDYWTITDSLGTYRVDAKTVKDDDDDSTDYSYRGRKSQASFQMRGSDVTAVPHVVRVVGSLGLKIDDSATLDTLSEGSYGVRATYVNVRDRAGALYYADSDKGDHNEWEKIYKLVKDEGAEGLDNITANESGVSGVSVERAKVEAVSGGKKVTYRVTIPKSLLGDDFSAAESLLAFEAQAGGASLSAQTAEDQNCDRRDVWYETEACRVSKADDGSQVISFSVTYTNKHRVTFDAGEGAFDSGAKTSTTTTDANGKLSAMPVPTREGYTFAGWYNGDQKVDPSTAFTSDVTLIADWKKGGETGDVTYVMALFNSKEGDSDEWSVYDLDLLEIPAGSTAKVAKPADPTREGYTFDGWYTDEDCTKAYDFDTTYAAGGSYDDVELYAKWMPETYTVSFDANGGTGAPEAQETVHGGIVTKPTTDPTREGYTFAGWTLNGAKYHFGEKVTGDMTLKASWKSANTVTVTYKDAAEQSVALLRAVALSDDDNTTTVTVVSGETAPSLQPADREGYRFAGWYDNEACEGDPFDFENTKITENTTLYAKWVAQCTVSFSTPDDAGQVASMTVDAGTQISTSDLPRVAREHYRFYGWVDENGQAVSDTLTADDDVALTARWKGETVFVWEHDVDGDAAYAMLSYGHELTYEDLRQNVDEQDPTREGYVFGGWYLDEGCTEALTYPYALTGDLDIYAKWTPEERAVTFDTKGGSDVAAQTVSYGELATQPEEPTKAGYVFDGWCTDEACTTGYDFSTAVTGNVTLYAKWANPVTVAFDAGEGDAVEPASVTVAEGTSLGALPYSRRGWSTFINEYGQAERYASDEDDYALFGWCTKGEAVIDGVKVPAGTQVYADSKIGSDCELVAMWVEANPGGDVTPDGRPDGKTDPSGDTDGDAGGETKPSGDAGKNGSGKKGLPRTGDVNTVVPVAAVAAAGVLLVAVSRRARQ